MAPGDPDDDLDILSDLAIDVEPRKLGVIAELVSEMRAQEDEIAHLEAALKLAKNRLNTIRMQEIPDLLLANNCRSFTTSDGVEVSLKKFYQASITEEKREDAHQWLRDHGHSSLIRHTVTASFDRGKDNAASDVVESLKERGIDYKDDQRVHPATLKAWVREMFEKGHPPPEELFGTFAAEMAVINQK